MSRKHVIEFLVRDIISYDDYYKIIEENKKWYQEEIVKINNLYDNLIVRRDFNDVFRIMKKHQNIIVNLIKKIISNFNLDDTMIGIYLSNSFARGTNLIDSDIDLNFMYEDLEKGKVIEELISNSLSLILGKYRDFVHDSISHRLPFSPSSAEALDEVEYNIIFDNKVISKKITKGNEKLMYNLYNSHKDINAFFKYYTGYLNNDDIAEWVYFQKEIYSSPNYLNKLFSYIKLTEKHIGCNKLFIQKENLKSKIKECLKVLEQDSFLEMRHFKQFFKNDIYRLIYETLILLRKNKGLYGFKDVDDLLILLKDDENIACVKEYFGNIMIFNRVCDLYGLEFRTRYIQEIPNEFCEFFKSVTGIKEDFTSYFKRICKLLLKVLLEEVESIPIRELKWDFYNPLYEQINIENYSPLSRINNMSKEYQHEPFLLPFIKNKGRIIPIHPDTLDDLKISRVEVIKYELVYPTSSFRTVYVVSKNIFYKLPILRQITRSIRDLKEKELKRSAIAARELSKYRADGFTFLKEKIHYGQEEIYNYMVREGLNKNVYPWFYLIVSNKFDKDFMFKCIEKMVSIWMFYASKGIYFESAHTQNFLVDDAANIYYRDLSDIRILEYEIMTPSYVEELKNKEELLSVFFDRSMCSQNIEHFIRYCPNISLEDINYLKKMIDDKIKLYGLKFPNYSMNYDKTRDGHHPVKVELVRLRDI